MANQDTTPPVNDQTTEYVQLEQYQDTTSIDDGLRPQITSTFYSDGTRQIMVKWKSYEGERKVLHDLEDLINGYFTITQDTQDTKVQEAYKKGFIDGGIEQLNKGGE